MLKEFLICVCNTVILDLCHCRSLEILTVWPLSEGPSTLLLTDSLSIAGLVLEAFLWVQMISSKIESHNDLTPKTGSMN